MFWVNFWTLGNLSVRGLYGRGRGRWGGGELEGFKGLKSFLVDIVSMDGFVLYIGFWMFILYCVISKSEYFVLSFFLYILFYTFLFLDFVILILSVQGPYGTGSKGAVQRCKYSLCWTKEFCFPHTIDTQSANCFFVVQIISFVAEYEFHCLHK